MKELQNVQASLAKADYKPIVINAQAGECYAQVWVEPKYKTLTKTAVLKEAASSIDIIPAQYKIVAEKILVSEQSSSLKVIPATYKTIIEKKLVQKGNLTWRISNNPNAAPADKDLLKKVSSYGIDLDGTQPSTCYHQHLMPAQFETVAEKVLVEGPHDVIKATDAKYKWVEKKVLVSEASSIIKEIPAVYKTVKENVIDRPAHTVWKKDTGPDQGTGEIMSLVEVPATYKTVSKQVLVSAATTRTTVIPAVYKTVRVKQFVADASEQRSTVPAKYCMINVTKKVTDATFVWNEIHDLNLIEKSRTGEQICLVKKPDLFKMVKTTVVDVPASTRKVIIPVKYKTVNVKKLVLAETTRETKVPVKFQTVKTQVLDKPGHMEFRVRFFSSFADDIL